MIAEGTIEEKVLEIQARKSELIEQASGFSLLRVGRLSSSL
jgi:SNF2 family DNA or RNA helicase